MRRVAGGNKIRAHLRQCAGQRLRVRFAYVRERLGASGLANLLHRGDQLIGGGPEKQLPDAPVGWVIAPLNERDRLEPVEYAAERDRLNVEDVGKRALLDALVACEIGEHLPLRAGEPEFARVLLETLPQKARGVIDQEAKSDGKAGQG